MKYTIKYFIYYDLDDKHIYRLRFIISRRMINFFLWKFGNVKAKVFETCLEIKLILSSCVWWLVPYTTPITYLRNLILISVILLSRMTVSLPLLHQTPNYQPHCHSPWNYIFKLSLLPSNSHPSSSFNLSKCHFLCWKKYTCTLNIYLLNSSNLPPSYLPSVPMLYYLILLKMLFIPDWRAISLPWFRFSISFSLAI